MGAANAFSFFRKGGDAQLPDGDALDMEIVEPALAQAQLLDGQRANGECADRGAADGQGPGSR